MKERKAQRKIKLVAFRGNLFYVREWGGVDKHVSVFNAS
jgi:hypothetical protein